MIALRPKEDWRPPKFLLRGARLTSSNSDCRAVIVEPKVLQVELEAERVRLAALRADVEALRERLEKAKDGIGQGGLALSTQLRRLRERHGVHPIYYPLPLAPPIEASSLRIKGYAATCDTDLDSSRFCVGCWPALDPSTIKLLISHDFDRVAGTVDAIEVDALGRVIVTATVTDPMGQRMPALSISAAVERYTIINSDSPDFVGEIQAVSAVNEVSLSSTPSNRHAIIFERTVPSPIDLSYADLIARAKRALALAQALAAA